MKQNPLPFKQFHDLLREIRYILIVAAIITPTADIMTLVIVSLPIWLLYEVSILLVRTVSSKNPAA